jgi:hypothetical protein
MKSKAGLWIDPKKAVIVFLTHEKQEIKLIKSNVEKQDRRSATSRHEGPFESQSLAAEDHRDRAFMGHLDIYYNNVIPLSALPKLFSYLARARPKAS